jgi:hypothetical protein
MVWLAVLLKSLPVSAAFKISSVTYYLLTLHACILPTDAHAMRPASSFLLALASPVLHRMLCGSFSEIKEKNLMINDVDIGVFIRLLTFGAGGCPASSAGHKGRCRQPGAVPARDRVRPSRLHGRVQQYRLLGPLLL